MTQGSRNKARQAAVQALYQWQMTQQPPLDIEKSFISDTDLSGVDRAYFQELIREVPAQAQELDGLLAPHLDRPLAEIDPVERAVLRIGAYEFAYRLEIPYKVVLNEAVELTKTFGAEQGHRYVNGVLDKLAAALRPAEVALRAGR